MDHCIQDEGLYARPFAGVRLGAHIAITGEFIQGSAPPWVRLAVALDLPISFALDTVLLPMDAGLAIFRDRPSAR